MLSRLEGLLETVGIEVTAKVSGLVHILEIISDVQQT